jgi:hypothetical protein
MLGGGWVVGAPFAVVETGPAEHAATTASRPITVIEIGAHCCVRSWVACRRCIVFSCLS